MTNFATLYYIADILKYFAVPTAAYEFFSDETKQKIEQWILKKLPKLLLAAVLFFFVISLFLVILAYASIFLVIAFTLIAFIGSYYSETISKYKNNVFIAALIFAILQQWIIPQSWTIALAYPLEFICTTLQEVPIINTFLPEYSATQFVTNYQNAFANINMTFGKQWHYPTEAYFFATKGLLLLIILLLDVLVLVYILLLLFLILLFPLNLIIKLSDYLKRVLNMTEKAVPIGAFIVWSIGETIAILCTSYDFFFVN